MYFKGEIYNRRELGFAGDDAEAVAAAYATWGENAFAKLRGSFAVALDDGSKTILVRDQFGAVPLYYWIAPDGRVFFSDRVLDLLAQGVPRRLSREGLISYLTYGCVCSPLTMIEGVHAVPQGHLVEIEKGSATVSRYWMPDFKTRDWTPTDAQEAVTSAVRESIDLQMRVTDEVPAAFLSGGIDSGAIVAVMRQLYDGEIRTYCVRHDDDTTQESEWAQKVADANRTRHTTLRLTDAMMRENVLNAISSYDQPTIDGLNFWFASKLVKVAGEKVVFSGEGGDELFAGYNRFAKNTMAYAGAAKLRKMGSGVWGGVVGPLIEALAPNEKIRKLGALMQNRCDPYSLPRKIFGPGQVLSFLRPELRLPVRDFQEQYIGEAIPVEDIINRISWLELQTVTSDLWLRDGYQTSAAHGLGVRTPLLDPKLAELLYAIPGSMKLTPDYLKPLLVRAAGQGLSMDCVKRPKMGFSLPFQRYFTGDLKDMIEGFLDGKDLRLFRPEAVRKLGKLYHAGRVNWSRVWSLFVVEHWCRKNNISLPLH